MLSIHGSKTLREYLAGVPELLTPTEREVKARLRSMERTYLGLYQHSPAYLERVRREGTVEV